MVEVSGSPQMGHVSEVPLSPRAVVRPVVACAFGRRLHLLAFRAWGFGLRVSDFGFGVSGLVVELRVPGSGSGISGSGSGLISRVQGLGLRFKG